MRYILLLILLVLMSVNGRAGKLERGFEVLSVFNYFKAKELFERSMKRSPSPASFGLATIYFRKDNPFHSLDSAYRYILIAEKEFSQLTDKKKERLIRYGFNYLAIADLQRSVSSGFYDRALKQNTVGGFDVFLEKHPWSLEYHKALFKRDSIAFSLAKNSNTSQVFAEFLEKYPESQFLNEAKEQFNLLQYKEQTADNKLSSYVEFLTVSPSNPYTRDAENRIFELVTAPNNIEAFHKFIVTYPSNQNVGEAWRRIYQLFMVDFSDNRIEEFKREFPEFPYTEELEADLNFSRRQLLPFKSGSLFGYMDYEGKIIVEADYEYLGLFKEGLAVAAKNGKYGFVDKGNRTVIPFEFDNATDFENGRAIVELGGKFGMIDRGGRTVLPIEFDDLGTVAEGLVYGAKNDKYGYYDKSGMLKIEERFDEAFSFSNGLAKVQLEDKQGYIDPYGTFMVPPGYSNISFFSDTLLVFEEDGYFGLMLKSGTQVLTADQEEVGPLKDGRALIVRQDQIGYIDAKAAVVIPLKFEIYPNYLTKGTFKGNYAIAVSKGKYGVIDKSGKFIIPATYTGLGEVSSLLAFNKGKGWGFIDLTGKEIIKPQFDYAESFKGGQAIVEKLTLSGVIDSKGNFVIPCEYASIDRFGEDYYLVSTGSKFGVYDKKGKLVVPIEYQQILFSNGDLMLLTNSNELNYFYVSEQRIIKPIEANE